MKIFHLIITVFITLAGSCGFAAAQPNVVFIMADDLGYGDLGCYGATHFETPACDRLAREGMRFTDAHSPSAVCTPTRYAVLTGRYAWRTWLKNWVLFAEHPLLIEPERLTMGRLFQQAGYVSGCVGKWHLGWGRELNPDFSGEVKPGPLEVGFDSFYGVPFSHNSPKPLQVFMRDRRIVNLPPGLKYNSPEAMKKTVRRLEDTAIELSREAVAFVDLNKDKPFFLYYPTTNIHFPLTPNRRFKGTTKSGVYGEFVVEFDWAVGELLAALDRHGLAENTIVVLTSDNGARPHASLNGHACNGPLRGTKRQIYEGGHRIPLIVRWPGQVAEGSVSKETVCLTDFFTTFAGLLRQSVPENAGEDSVDIMDFLLNRSRKPVREATVHHSVSGQFALRKGDWKLIEGRGDGDYPKKAKGGIDIKTKEIERDPVTGRWTKLDYFRLKPDGVFQLFNLKKDPAEKNDVAQAHPEVVESMSRLLNQYRDKDRSVPYLGIGSTRGFVEFKRPPDAVQLVGNEHSVFVPESDTPSQWTFKHGVLTASPQWDSVITPEAYRDFRLHLEFNVNDRPGVDAEKNGNSGVYIQQRYEVQILNSYGVSEADYKASYCGSLYRQKMPDQLVCKPAGEWQTYDIVFRAARFDGEKRVANARITVYQNGELIHDDYALKGKTGVGKKEGPEPGPIKLQGHQNPVRFRNIWIERLNL